MSLNNLVTDNFKEYDFDTEYCLNIYITTLLFLNMCIWANIMLSPSEQNSF
jgi:hypothetical protein